jgi:hypothetical protein
MSYLLCEKHGREREAEIIAQQEMYRQEGESLLAATGRLVSGPWQCDRCGAQLRKGGQAMLFSAFPGHFHDQLCDYDFGYERQYFAMIGNDTATAYGAEWPDDSIRNRRKLSRPASQPKKPVCALDLPTPKPAE